MSDGCPGSLGFLVLCPPLGDGLLPLPVAPSWRDGRKRCTPWSWCRGLLCAPAVEMCHLCLLHRAVLGSRCSPCPSSLCPSGEPLLRLKLVTQVARCFTSQGICLLQSLVHQVQVARPAEQFSSMGKKKKKKELDLLHAPFSQPKCLKV